MSNYTKEQIIQALDESLEQLDSDEQRYFFTEAFLSALSALEKNNTPTGVESE